MDTPAVDDAYRAAVAALHEAWSCVRAELRALPDLRLRFDNATALGDLARQFESESVDERADAAEAIKDADSLNITALSERISMSKQRAGKLLEKARKRQEGS